MLSDLLTNLISLFKKVFIENLKEKIAGLISIIKKQVLASIFMIMGSIFLLIAITIYLNELIGKSPAIGYGISGAIVLLLGVVIHKTSK